VPEEALARVSANLERMVDPQRGIADLGSFAAKVQELLHRVCAVELGNEWGTGFLIGPETGPDEPPRRRQGDRGVA